MLAYGVVFVLLLGEIDLSISYVAGIGALTVAILQNPGSPARFLGSPAEQPRAQRPGRDGRRRPGVRGDRLTPGHGRRKGRRAVVRRDPGRLPHLAGRDPAPARGAGLDHHPGPLDQLHRELHVLARRRVADRGRSSRASTRSWRSGGVIGKRRAGIAVRDPRARHPQGRRGRHRQLRHRRDLQPRGHPGHAARPAAPRRDHRRVPRRLDVPREADDVRPPRLRRRRQCRGRPARGHQRLADPHPRVHHLELDGRRRRHHPRRERQLGRPQLRRRHAAA